MKKLLFGLLKFCIIIIRSQKFENELLESYCVINYWIPHLSNQIQSKHRLKVCETCLHYKRPTWWKCLSSTTMLHFHLSLHTHISQPLVMLPPPTRGDVENGSSSLVGDTLDGGLLGKTTSNQIVIFLHIFKQITVKPFFL